MTLAKLKALIGKLKELDSPQFYVCQPRMAAELRAATQPVDPFGGVGLAVVFGPAIYEKEQRHPCWSFTDRETCFAYLEGKLSEEDLEKISGVGSARTDAAPAK